MKDRRHVAPFYTIRRHKNHDILLSPIPGIIPAEEVMTLYQSVIFNRYALVA